MKSANERAEKIDHICIMAFPHKPDIDLIVKELEAYAEERLAERDLETFGEAFMLGGKRIGPNDIFKSTADYVNEARAEGRRAGIEEAAKVAERCIEHYSKDEPMVVLHSNVFKMIRALKESEI